MEDKEQLHYPEWIDALKADLCLQVLSKNGNDLRLLWAKAFPHRTYDVVVVGTFFRHSFVQDSNPLPSDKIAKKNCL